MRMIRDAPSLREIYAMLLYAVVLFTSIAGMLQASWWGAVFAGCTMVLVLLVEQSGGWEASKDVSAGDPVVWDLAHTSSSLLITLVATPLAFAVGRVTATIWGI
jgi:hypothetical protein